MGMQIHKLLNSWNSVHFSLVAAVRCPDTSDSKYLSFAIFSNPEDYPGVVALNYPHAPSYHRADDVSKEQPAFVFQLLGFVVTGYGSGWSQTCCNFVLL